MTCICFASLRASGYLLIRNSYRPLEAEAPKSVDIQCIYRTTIKLFTKRGYVSASTKENAARAGMNEAALYRRFGTKAELIRVSLQEVLAGSPFGKLRASGDVHDDIAMIAWAYIETYQSFGAVVMTLMTVAARHAEIRGAIGALMPNLQNAAGIIAAHQKTGRITAVEPMATLLNLIAPLAVTGRVSRTGLSTGSGIAGLATTKSQRDFWQGIKSASSAKISTLPKREYGVG